MGALDRNGNGTLEQEEIDLAVASLRKLDRNKDGQVTRDEVFSPQRPARQDGRPQMSFASFDKNGDGKISKEEAPERMKENFSRIDRNEDGYIDAREQEALRRMIRERAGGGPRPQGRPGGRPELENGRGGTDRPRRPAPKDE